MREEDVTFAEIVARAVAKMSLVRVPGEGENGEGVGRVGQRCGGMKLDALEGLRAKVLGGLW